jgi:hypothetical protein
MHMHIHLYVYIYIYMYAYICIYIGARGSSERVSISGREETPKGEGGRGRPRGEV